MPLNETKDSSDDSRHGEKGSRPQRDDHDFVVRATTCVLPGPIFREPSNCDVLKLIEAFCGLWLILRYTQPVAFAIGLVKSNCARNRLHDCFMHY